MSTLSIFDAAREAPDALALIDGELRLSFREVAQRTERYAGVLWRAQPRTLAFTPHADVESLLWLYAAFATGTPVLPLHARATTPEIAHAMALASATGLPPYSEQPFDVECLGAIDDSTTLVHLPTSGSTGSPRLVQLSRAALLASAHASAQNLGWQADDRWLLCLPLSHTGGLSIVTRSLLARRAVSLFEPGPSGTLAQLPRLARALEDATLVSLVPSVLTALLDAGFVAPAGLRAVLVGGAGCAPELAERARSAGIPLLTSYGLTETASQVVTRRYAERFLPLPTRRGVVSSGQPLPGVELRLDGETIALRSPSLFSGYLGAATAPFDTEGWLVTSDRGELGDDGELYVRGRSDDVIVTGGENVDPLEVEAALYELPAIKAACVFGTPSARFGEVVTALLVSSDTTLGEPSHLAKLLGERLARHKCPRRALLVEQLPLTASGKVDRRACRAHFVAQLEQES
ncbi:MAG TPA: AMP-binding protein [Polyangiaceae bacterium]|nr:AMP-binding protein [Polyangiaceae bacterium]